MPFVTRMSFRCLTAPTTLASPPTWYDCTYVYVDMCICLCVCTRIPLHKHSERPNSSVHYPETQQNSWNARKDPKVNEMERHEWEQRKIKAS